MANRRECHQLLSRVQGERGFWTWQQYVCMAASRIDCHQVGLLEVLRSMAGKPRAGDVDGH